MFQFVSYDSAHMVHTVHDRALNILHLEDSFADHELAVVILRRAGLTITVQQVETLADFRRLLSTEAFDLILADYRLPGFTALDAWAVASELVHRPPFVLLSGAIGEAAAVDVMRLGVSDYLLKENISRLPHVISRAIEVHDARRAREQAMDKLALSEHRLAKLTEHLQTSIEHERASIAREIHDDIGGALTAARFDVAWIRRHTQEAAVHAHADAALDMLQHAVGASQRIMMNLRPPILEEGLVAAVQWLAAGFERRTGIKTRLSCSSHTIKADPDTLLTAYRTAQEALTNISKYARATQVLIDLSDRESVLTLEVTDNGQGLPPDLPKKPGVFGLKGLEERARSVGGWLDISSQPHRGTSITLSVPLARAEDATLPGDAP